jgi:glutamyl-tRNA reductase
MGSSRGPVGVAPERRRPGSHKKAVSFMRITCVSISHKSATLELLEQLVLDDEAAGRLGRSLLQEPAVAEVVVLSTCNRTEVYACGDDVSAMQRLILEGLGSCAQVEALAPHANVFSDREAIIHLFRVAASLDSMVVGETQVLAQVKGAHRLAGTAGSTGIVLNHLFRQAIATGKRVHTETSVGRRPVSLASAAVDLAAQVCGDLKTRSALVLGAGQIDRKSVV